ncbi:MAG: PspA/IM30 family protein [Planctomycetaceae bacterium]|nr:PspA/IM30 family protein [Planctomycetaceae bacterium]
MPHFSRLTDIVTCSLTEIINSAEDPAVTLQEVISEMEEGLAACRRTVSSSQSNVNRLTREIDQSTRLINEWVTVAREKLHAGDETAARDALSRKVEQEDLIAGLQPEKEAAESTWQNMLRIQKALEARHAEARRRLREMTGHDAVPTLNSETALMASDAVESVRQSEIDAELDALRRELGM